MGQRDFGNGSLKIMGSAVCNQVADVHGGSQLHTVVLLCLGDAAGRLGIPRDVEATACHFVPGFQVASSWHHLVSISRHAPLHLLQLAYEAVVGYATGPRFVERVLGAFALEHSSGFLCHIPPS